MRAASIRRATRWTSPTSTTTVRWPSSACARQPGAWRRSWTPTWANEAEPDVSPRVQPFHHRDTGTWSYVVDGGDGSAAAIIDPVLDFDIKSGRTGPASAQALLDYADAHRLDVRW